MYHPYVKGYDVLPKLKKTDGPFFQITEDRDRFLFEKQISLKNQVCFAEHDVTDEVYETVCDFIVEQYPEKIERPHSFENIALQIQEDLVIHKMTDDKDWVAAVHVCLPFGWHPDKQVGHSFEEIHQPVPGINLKHSRKMVEAMVNHGPFERFVWTVLFEDCINLHPSRPRKSFDPKSPEVWVKVERQLTYGFPEHNAALFVLRQHLVPEKDINKPALAKTLSEMNEEQRKYKGFGKDIETVIEYLHGCTSGEQNS